MNDFDQAARFAARLDPNGFIQWLILDLPRTVVFRRWLDTRTVAFPGGSDRTCDAGKRGIIEQWKVTASLEKDSRLRTTYAGLAVVFADLAGRGRLWREALEGWNMGESAFLNEMRAETHKKDLLRVIELRFAKKLPNDVVTAVKAESDRVKLEKWLDAAVIAASPDEFRAAMGQ